MSHSAFAARAVAIIAGLQLVVGAVAAQTVPPITPSKPAAAPAAAGQPPAAHKPAAPQPHPRLARAIGDLQAAISYMQAAPHDFGGHKAEAIASAKTALTQLREAQKYRPPLATQPSALGMKPAAKTSTAATKAPAGTTIVNQ